MSAALAPVVAWWLSIAASKDRDWLPEVARLPTADPEFARGIRQGLTRMDAVASRAEPEG